MDGYNFFSYTWRTPNAMMNLVGFKVTSINGLVVQITGVDHLQTGILRALASKNIPAMITNAFSNPTNEV